MRHKGQTRVSCTGGGCGDMLCRVQGNRNVGFNVLAPSGWHHVPGRGGKLNEFLLDLLSEHNRAENCQGTQWHYGPHDDEDEILLESWRAADQEQRKRRDEENRKAKELEQVKAREENRQRYLDQREVETAHGGRKDQVIAEQEARKNRCLCHGWPVLNCPYPRDEWGEKWVPRASVDVGTYAPSSLRQTFY